jgi:demethylmenaquinone methyltransferase/2-methoxy-6-polyprenyl-1,4-benzoquinol methylase
MNNSILDEQIEYYRARAQEYDASISGATEIFEPARSMLLKLGNFDQILELACGTGFWTDTLLSMGGDVTAVDAAPEMLDIARKRLGEDRIKYRQSNLFQWRPEQEYDLIFFANWLSHVPPSALDGFLGKVQHTVRSGGQIAIIDRAKRGRQTCGEGGYLCRTSAG